MNTYLIHGKDIYRQELALADILKKNRIPKDRITVIDASDKKTFRIEEVLVACDSISLFGEEGIRAVIVDRPYYLNASVKYAEAVKKGDSPAIKSRKEKELKDRDYRMDLLKQYLRSPNPDVILIFCCRDFTADSRKKDYKLLKEMNVSILEEKKLSRQEFRQFALETLKKNRLTLTPDAMQELLVRVEQDTMRLKNAVDSLVLYGEEKIDLDAVRHLVPVSQDIQLYALGDAFLKGNIKEALRIKEELSVRNIPVSTMVTSMAGTLRRFYHMKRMDENYFDIKVIASKLNLMDWIVQNQLRDCRISSKKILKWLSELADLDQGIKAGLITDPDHAFELWIIGAGGVLNGA